MAVYNVSRGSDELGTLISALSAYRHGADEEDRERTERSVADKAAKTVDKILGDYLEKKKGEYTEPEYSLSGGDPLSKDVSYKPNQSNQPDLVQILKGISSDKGVSTDRAYGDEYGYDQYEGKNLNTEEWAKDIFTKAQQEKERLRDKETQAIQSHYKNADPYGYETSPIEKTMTKQGAYNNPLTGADLEALDDEYRMRVEAAKAGVHHRYLMPDTKEMFYDEKRFQKGGYAPMSKPLIDERGYVYMYDRNGNLQQKLDPKTGKPLIARPDTKTGQLIYTIPGSDFKTMEQTAREKEEASKNNIYNEKNKHPKLAKDEAGNYMIPNGKGGFYETDQYGNRKIKK